MTKAEIRSLIFNHLPKWDASSKYHFRFVDAAIEQVVKEMYWELFAIDPHAIQRYLVRYGVTSPVAVTLNNTLGFYTSILPADIVPLPDKASGVRRISTIAQAGLTFFPMDSREFDLVKSSSYVNTVTSKIGYVVNQTTIDYCGMTAAISAVGVRMDILQVFSAYADTDIVLLPELVTGEGIDFTQRVLRTLQVIPPVSQSDDNADDTPTKLQK